MRDRRNKSETEGKMRVRQEEEHESEMAGKEKLRLIGRKVNKNETGRK